MKIAEHRNWDLLAAAPLFFGAAFLPWAQGGESFLGIGDIGFDGGAWFVVCALCLLGLAAGTDILRRPRNWMRPTAALLIASAGGMASAGLLAGGAVDWMFQDNTELPGQPFGGFFHYSLAGAYLNLVWPLGFALAVAPGQGSVRRAVTAGRWLAALLAALAFVAIWTLPTAAARGLSLALLATLLLAWRESNKRDFCDFWTRACQHYGRAKAFAGLVAAMALLAVFLGFTVAAPTIRDWGSVTASKSVAELKTALPDRGDLMLLSEDPRANLPQFERRIAWATALSMVPDAGFFSDRGLEHGKRPTQRTPTIYLSWAFFFTSNSHTTTSCNLLSRGSVILIIRLSH